MSAAGTVEPPLDDIRTIMGNIGDEEHEARAKLRSLRNAASGLLANAHCDTARHLAWTVIEWASPNLYSPAPLEWLDQLNLLCKRLMLTAMQCEDMLLIHSGVGDE